MNRHLESSISFFLGPSAVNYCQNNKLWKRSPVYLSCDFDVYNVPNSLNQYFWSAVQPNKKESVGTFCLFENLFDRWLSEDEKVGKWKLSSSFKWSLARGSGESSKNVLTFSPSFRANRARLASLFFQLPTSEPTCLSFRYNFDGSQNCHRKSSLINVFLFPCRPAYHVPVATFKPSNRRWSLATVPLPRHNHPYRVVIEGVSNNKNCHVSIDDVIFSACG